MTGIEIELPWPPRGLSPNGSHRHWAVRAKAKKRYRNACWTAVRELGLAGILPNGDSPLMVSLTFVPPNRRRRDVDNLIAAMKAGLDGVAEALELDDARFRLAAPVVAEPDGDDGFVVVCIEPAVSITDRYRVTAGNRSQREREDQAFVDRLNAAANGTPTSGNREPHIARAQEVTP